MHQLWKSLSKLFGSASYADCVLRFYVATSDGLHGKPDRHFIGDPLPAHQLVLSGGSERFQAQIERWRDREDDYDSYQNDNYASHENSFNADERVHLRLIVGGGASERMHSRPSRSTRQLPELLVPLGSEDELPHTLLALRYLYTGNVQQLEGSHGSSAVGAGAGRVHANLTVRDLLLVRRQAGYLQIAGCIEACDAAIAQQFRHTTGGTPAPSHGTGTTTTTTTSCPFCPAPSPLAAVLSLYDNRDLLPSPREEPGIATALRACLQFLLRNWDSPLPPPCPADGPASASTSASGTASPTPTHANAPLHHAFLPSQPHHPTKGDLLAWLLGGDAVAVANDPNRLQQLLTLPAAALEELLRSDTLATDDEATVVLLVERWMESSLASHAAQTRVRELLRLCNCNTSYLTDLLPELGWLASGEAAFMARLHSSTPPERKRLLEAYGTKYGTSRPWYGSPRPQSIPEYGMSYEWEVGAGELVEALGGEPDKLANVYAAFCDGPTSSSGGHTVQRCSGGGGGGSSKPSVVAWGFEWQVRIVHCPGDPHAGVYLKCLVPAVLRERLGTALEGAACVLARLEVFYWRGSQRRVAFLSEYGSDDFIGYDSGWGTEAALPLGGAGRMLAGVAVGGGGAGDGSHGGDGAGGQAEGGGGRRGSGGGSGAGVVGEEGSREAGLLAPWAEYLGPGSGLGGRITGRLTFLRPPAVRLKW